MPNTHPIDPKEAHQPSSPPQYFVPQDVCAIKAGGSRFQTVAIITLAMILPTLFAILNFVILPGNGAALNTIRTVSIWIGKLTQFSLPVAVLLAIQSQRTRFSLLSLPSVWNWLWGVGFGCLVGGVLILLYYLFLQDHPVAMGFTRKLYQYLAESDLASPAGFLTLGLFTAVIHSLLE